MNPVMLIELLRVGAQLVSTLNQIKAQVEKEDPALWASIADEFNKAVKTFQGDQS